MKRYEIIQALIDHNKYRSYLEIGCQYGECFNQIRCDYKVAVDPDPESVATHISTSTKFFENNSEVFQIILIDGDHNYLQVQEDINNAMTRISKDGIIICHDMLPPSEEHENPYLNGTCWRAFVESRTKRNDFIFHTVDTDQGIGLIKRGMGNLLEVNISLTYSNFSQNKLRWMNVISVEEFKKQFLS